MKLIMLTLMSTTLCCTLRAAICQLLGELYYPIPSKIPWRPRNLRQLISVQRLHDLAQALMTVVLVVPHVLMVFHLPGLIQSQRHKAVDRLREMNYPWGILLLHFENELGIGARDDLCG